MGNLFNRPINQTELPENSQAVAREIYGYLIEGDDESEILVKYEYDTRWSRWVYDKAKKLEADAIASIKANPSQTDVEWAGSVSVAKLHKVTVLNDIIKFNPTYKEDRTFEEFVIAMTAGE